MTAPGHRGAASLATAAADFVLRAAARIRSAGLGRTAASLSFTTLFALVPLATVAFTVVSRFPVFQDWVSQLEAFLMRYMLPGSAYEVVHTYITEFTEKAANLTGLSILFLAVTALMATDTIEREINLIWGIRQQRPFGRRLLVYVLGITVGPVLLGASLSLSTWVISRSLAAIPLGQTVEDAVLEIVPVLFTTIALALLYTVVPARRVPWRSAFIGGALAAIAFEAAKQGFAIYVTRFSNYQIVYGALAALPVFLIWIYVSWLIVLAGAAVTAMLSDAHRPR